MFKQARDRSATAAKKAGSLQHARTPEELKELWSEFLVNYHRSFSRLGNAMDTPAEQGWFDRLSATRKADQLLQYLAQARDADEHGREEIAAASAAGVTIGGGGEPLFIRNMTIRNGRLEALTGWQGQPGNPIKIEFQPGELKLQPVTNRGRVYPVPSSHMNKALHDQSPAGAAAAGLAFLNNTLDEADRLFRN